MKPEYDFLKSTTKKGGILLSAEWLEKNLGMKKGETIISVSIGGKVLLTRFNPDVAFDAKTLEMLANGNSAATVTADPKEAAPEEIFDTTSLGEPNSPDVYSDVTGASNEHHTSESLPTEHLANESL